MAGVSGRPTDRGQLLLVAAIAIALLLSVLALTLNTAVDGGVHVAQSTESLRSERGALQYQTSVRRGVGGLLPTVNAGAVEYDDLHRTLDEGVTNWSDLSKPAYARDDVSTNASLTAVDFRTRIVQDDPGGFTDATGAADWTIASNVSDVRGYEMNVSGDRLVETADCSTGAGCFVLSVAGAGGEWRLTVGKPTNTSVRVTVTDGVVTDVCTATRTPVLINVSAGTVDDGTGTCSFTTVGQSTQVDPPYTLTYHHAGNVSGTYALDVNGRVTGGTIAADGRYGTTGSPRLEPRIGSATVAVRYRSADLTYRTAIQVTTEGADG